MGYLTYYLIILLASFLFAVPWLVPLVIVVYWLRRFLPDPYIFARTAGHVQRLRAQVKANPANATARRDLARIHLERFRPREALRLLDEALGRHPDDPELLYLVGLAHLRSGRPEAALAPLVRAVDIDPRVGFGDPYRIAGDALTEMGRHEEAEDAYERYTQMNSSSLEGLYKLARARRRLGDVEGARQALEELFDTFRALPAFSRRKQWPWVVRGRALRVVA